MTAGESGHALVGQSKEQLQTLEQAWSAELDAISGANQQLDLSRGKPGVEQLALSDGLETMIAGDYISIDGPDTRNYGGLTGIAEARALAHRSWTYQLMKLWPLAIQALISCIWCCTRQPTSVCGVTNVNGATATRSKS